MPIVKSRIRDGSYTPWVCPNCQASIEFKLETKTTQATILCANCNKNVTWSLPSSTSSHEQAQGAFSSSDKKDKSKSSSEKSSSKGKYRIGTDTNPIETEYYEILNVPVTATLAEIKTSYRKLAIIYHPDKNPDDPAMAEKFKNIATAYATLSDPKLRSSYNQFGTSKNRGAEEGGADMVDPEVIFSKLFGGDAFEDIIGTIALSMDMKQAMINAEAEENNEQLSEEEIKLRAAQKKDEEAKSEAERTKVRDERVKHLSEVLRRKLSNYASEVTSETDQSKLNELKKAWKDEVDELQTESYGADLLHVVGQTYRSKSRQYLASTGIVPWGMGGWLYSVKSTYGVVTETVSTVRSAYGLSSIYNEIQKAEEAGDQAKKAELEEKAAQLGLDTMFKGVRLEVTSVIREVCDNVLHDEKESVSTLRKRAVALGALGEIYGTAVKQEEPIPPPVDPSETTTTSS